MEHACFKHYDEESQQIFIDENHVVTMGKSFNALFLIKKRDTKKYFIVILVDCNERFDIFGVYILDSLPFICKKYVENKK